MPAILKFVLLAVVLAAACCDLRIRRIPNVLNLTGVLMGLVLHTLIMGWSGASAALFGLLAALCVYLPLYALKGMGAGDVKLMAAVGALAGPGNWLNIFMFTALLGGAAGLTLMLLRRKTSQTLLNISVIVGQLAKGRIPVRQDCSLSIHDQNSLKLPHGAIIAAGVVVFLAINQG